MSLRCPTHRTATPPRPRRSFDPATGSGRPCKGCGSPEGSDAERRAHHCPCCGEYFADGCLRPGTTAWCTHCGIYDPATGGFTPPPDPLADLLAGTLAPDTRRDAWIRAVQLFGIDVGYHLHRNDTHSVPRGHVAWTIAAGRRALPLRYLPATGQFDAGSACPRCPRGMVWTPVTTRTELLTIHQHGPGPNATGCSRCRT
ncbi:hypothetical protein ACQP2U_43680 (plasmid) [Nocardia sp. CA-084685]|uniref:hypothetical protein n=1 Tax=Nocardia sp. CA-084685 TaxID=3239970 RepID=UPI003D97901E